MKNRASFLLVGGGLLVQGVPPAGGEIPEVASVVGVGLLRFS